LRVHYDRISLICQRITGNAADADDATQEAMMAIARGISHFDGRSNITTWLYRVTTNACLDELRRRRRRPVPGLPAVEHFDRPGDGSAYGAGAEDSVADRLRLEAALAALPEDYRVPVVLRDIGDLDYAEIALVLDIPPGTVRSRIARGRMALAQTLGNDRGNQTPPTGRQTDAP
jgi:RNA polymerase sigma-70 factor, ECF subfamily